MTLTMISQQNATAVAPPGIDRVERSKKSCDRRRGLVSQVFGGCFQPELSWHTLDARNVTFHSPCSGTVRDARMDVGHTRARTYIDLYDRDLIYTVHDQGVRDY